MTGDRMTAKVRNVDRNSDLVCLSRQVADEARISNQFSSMVDSYLEVASEKLSLGVEGS